jgi:putative FmdB family regulatory protein
VPTYAFRCPDCGPFDRLASITAVPDALPCPGCAAPARRAVTAPALHTPGTGSAIAAAHERSAHAPGVVSGVPTGPAPGASPRPAPADPRHARLPRP